MNKNARNIYKINYSITYHSYLESKDMKVIEKV